MQDRHILERACFLEQSLDYYSCFADRLDTFRRCLAYNPSCQCRTRKRNALKQLGGKSEGLTGLPDAVLAELNERLDDAVAEGVLRIDSELLENIMLSLDPCDGFVDIRQDGALKKELRPALLDQASEDFSVEGLGYCFALLLGVGNSLEGAEELVPGVEHLDRDPELPEQVRYSLGFSLTHETIFDENRSESAIQGPMAEHRDRGRIHAAG